MKCSTWMQSQKRRDDLGSFPRQTSQYHSNSSLCPAGATAALCTGLATVRRCPTCKGRKTPAKTVGAGAVLGQDLLAYMKKYSTSQYTTSVNQLSGYRFEIPASIFLALCQSGQQLIRILLVRYTRF